MVKLHPQRLLLAAAFSVPFALALGAFAAPPPAQEPVCDSKAITLLKQSAARMRALKTFSIHAEVTRDRVIRDGFKVQKTSTQDVLVQEPNALRADISGDIGRRLFVYDGKTISFLAEPENYYATVAAAPTLEATLDDILDRYDVDLPLADLVYTAAGGNLGKYIEEAGIIGTSRVAGTDCDHLAFRTKAVDWQVWNDKETLLPKKIVVTTRDEKYAPQYEALLTWNTSPKIADGSFAFAPPAGAQQMSVLNRDRTVAERGR